MLKVLAFERVVPQKKVDICCHTGICFVEWKKGIAVLSWQQSELVGKGGGIKDLKDQCFQGCSWSTEWSRPPHLISFFHHSCLLCNSLYISRKLCQFSQVPALTPRPRISMQVPLAWLWPLVVIGILSKSQKQISISLLFPTCISPSKWHGNKKY